MAAVACVAVKAKLISVTDVALPLPKIVYWVIVREEFIILIWI